MTFGKVDIQRDCSLPKRDGSDGRTIEDCGHPSLRFRPAAEHCLGCVTSSLRGGFAVDVPANRSNLEVVKK